MYNIRVCVYIKKIKIKMPRNVRCLTDTAQKCVSLKNIYCFLYWTVMYSTTEQGNCR